MIFGTRHGQKFGFKLGGHKIRISTDFFNMPWVFVAKLGTSTTQLRNIFLSKLGRQCMYYLNDFEILIFQLTKHIVVRCVAFKIAKLSNIDIWNGIQYSRSISPAKLL